MLGWYQNVVRVVTEIVGIYSRCIRCVRACFDSLQQWQNQLFLSANSSVAVGMTQTKREMEVKLSIRVATVNATT